MSPEKLQWLLLGLLALAVAALAWQGLARVRFERWARAELARKQLAHERLARSVREIDLRVPKRQAGWGTMLDDAATRELQAGETFPAIDLGALAASKRQ